VSAAAAAGSLPERAARGAMALFLRSAAVRLFGVAGGVVLARILTPHQFGVYAIAAFCVSFLALFSDVGLGAAIIQQHEEPTRDELKTVFTLQLLLAGTLVVVGMVVAAPVASAYHLSSADVWLIRALLFGLLLGAPRTVPAVLLERELRYSRLGTAESVEAAVFQLVAMVAALCGLGVWSFVLATMVRGVVGLVLLLWLSPWRIGLGVDLRVARRLASFGVAYQGQGVLSFVKDSMTPTLLAVIAGASAVGYVNWAYRVATLPLLVTSALWQVTFPAFSRARHDKALLARMIERSIRLGAIVMLPMSFSIIALAPQITDYVFTSKWHPALTSVYLFSICMWTGPLLGSTFFSLFYAMGKPRFSLLFTILYGVLDWGIGVPFVFWLGFNGIAVRAVIVAYGTLPLLLWAARSLVPVRPLRQVVRPAAVAGVVALGEFAAMHVVHPSPASFIATAICGAVAYTLLIVRVERQVLKALMVAVLPDRFLSPFGWSAAGVAPAP